MSLVGFTFIGDTKTCNELRDKEKADFYEKELENEEK